MGSGSQIDGVDITAITLDGQAGTIGSLYADGEKFSGILTVGTKTITFTNCFWTADLGFNAPSKDVYTLKNSPQSILLNNNDVIGAFGLGLFINAMLFIPQAIKLFRTKKVDGLSLITFSGFNIIQFFTILHGYFRKDYVLMIGFLLSFVFCGLVTMMIIFYKK